MDKTLVAEGVVNLSLHSLAACIAFEKGVGAFNFEMLLQLLYLIIAEVTGILAGTCFKMIYELRISQLHYLVLALVDRLHFFECCLDFLGELSWLSFERLLVACFF